MNILNKEFLLSIIDAFTEKSIYDESLNIITNDQKTIINNDIKNIINNNPNLINTNGKGKQNSDIRIGTNDIFLNRIKVIGSAGNFLSSNFKLKYIEKSSKEMETQYKQLKYLFNYYTQYQHFNPEASKLIQKNLDHDIYNYIATISEMLSVIEILIGFINIDDSEFLKGQFVGMCNYIEESFKEIEI